MNSSRETPLTTHPPALRPAAPSEGVTQKSDRPGLASPPCYSAACGTLGCHLLVPEERGCFIPKGLVGTEWAGEGDSLLSVWPQ